jgi:hypothetical protein
VLPSSGEPHAAERPDRHVPTAPDTLPAPRRAPGPASAAVDRAPAGTATLPAPPRAPVPRPHAGLKGLPDAGPAAEGQGCLYALSQPPLMLFLLVVGGLLGLGAAYDLIFV